MFASYALTLKIEKYIADPYWPEQEELINIQKSAGYNRLRNEDKREQALKAWLEKEGLTMKDYARLQKLAARPWYRQNGEKSVIIIPRHQMSGCLVQAVKGAPSGARVPVDALRSLILLSDLTTDKTEADGTFKRFVRPCDGTGKPLSNQRSLRANDYIEGAVASGSVELDADNVKPDTVRDLIKYAGKYIGVGASRKMGYGRFVVQEFALCPG